MANIDELRARRQRLHGASNETFAQADKITAESYRVADVAHNAKSIIENLDKEFEAQTKLRGKDIGFLFFATALQCVRQYFLTDFKTRLGNQEAAKNTKGHIEEHSDRHHRLYNPSIEQIIHNPVPFDTTFGGPEMAELVTTDSGKVVSVSPFAVYDKNFQKMGGNTLKHHTTTLGHDPILGWIFGTANIATSTLTNFRFQSFHIKTEADKRGINKDKLVKHASTAMVLSCSFDKLINQGAIGREKIAEALKKEAIHLASDIYSKEGLPFPIVASAISPIAASALANYGLDMGNLLTVEKQAALTAAINMLIGMIHRLTYNEETDGSLELFEVRTRKILSYSNAIATVSNIIAVAIGTALGVALDDPELVRKSKSKLDVGGFMVTIHRIATDQAFIAKIKEEFVLNGFDKLIQGDM